MRARAVKSKPKALRQFKVDALMQKSSYILPITFRMYMTRATKNDICEFERFNKNPSCCSALKTRMNKNLMNDFHNCLDIF